MIEKAVMGRFGEGRAVLLVGEEERQVVVPRKSLPKGAKEGLWLKYEFKGLLNIDGCQALPSQSLITPACPIIPVQFIHKWYNRVQTERIWSGGVT